MSKKSIGAILAITEDGVMGNGRDLPWPKGEIKGDLPHFKKVTENSVVIMGGKTFESLGGVPLPNRINIVVSSTLRDEIPGTYVYPSIPLALGFAALHSKPIWFIGGAHLLDQVIKMGVLDRLWITRVRDSYKGDVLLQWDADFLYDQGFVRTFNEPISDGRASIEYWGLAL